MTSHTMGHPEGAANAADNAAGSSPAVHLEKIVERDAQSLTVNGAHFYVEVRGQGSPVVLIHSGLTDCRMWEPQLADLSARHALVRYDLRGYGRSDLPPGPFSHVDDLRGLLRDLRLQPVALVGASLGGRIALDFTLEHPDMVERLVLLDPALSGHRWSAWIRQRWDVVGGALEAGDIDHAVELEIRMWVDGSGRSPDAVDPAVRRAVFEMNAQVMRRELRDDGVAQELDIDPPASERLETVDAPTLVVVGQYDTPDMLAIADRLEREVPGATKVDLPGTAHLPSMEKPSEVNRLILDWLSAGPRP